MREYKSYDEIETDLRILKLQKEIDKEEVKLNYKLTKRYIAPKALFKTTAKLIKRMVKEKAYIVKRVSEQYMDYYSNRKDSGLQIKVEKISEPNRGVAGTTTIISKGSTNI